MPEVWRVRYTLRTSVYQNLTFPSKNEAMNYITENFPAHVRAPNAEWESLVTRGTCRLPIGGVITVTCEYIAATPDSDATNSVCPHCSGYGSSLKDPERVNICTECGGSGVVSSEPLPPFFNEDPGR